MYEMSAIMYHYQTTEITKGNSEIVRKAIEAAIGQSVQLLQRQESANLTAKQYAKFPVCDNKIIYLYFCVHIYNNFYTFAKNFNLLIFKI